jgi:CHAT domain-containing protein/tetratricopeptide (TPR) repeat protein
MSRHCLLATTALAWFLPLQQSQALADDKADLAELLKEAGILSAAREFKEAAPLYEKALPLAVKLRGENDKVVAGILCDLGKAQNEQGKFAEPERLFLRALEIYEKTSGKDHADVVNALDPLGYLYLNQGKYPAAEPCFQRSLDINEKAHGKDDLSVANSANLLGILRARQANFAEAEKLFRRALAIREKVYGKASAQVAAMKGNLANICLERGKYEDAETLYQEALETLEKLVGKDHTALTNVVLNLANLRNTLGKYAEAERLYLRSLELAEKSYGKDSMHILGALANLASFYQSQGKYSEAEPLLLRCIATIEKIHGREHLSLVFYLTNVASLDIKLQKFDEAEQLCRRGLAIAEKHGKPDGPTYAKALNVLAEVQEKQGQLQKAETLYERVLTIYEKAFGKEHVTIGETLNAFAALKLTAKDYKAAEALFRRSLAIYEKSIGKSHPTVGVIINNLGVVCERQGRHDEAKPLYERSLAIQEAALGKAHPQLADTLHNLSLLYATLGQHADASRLQTQLRQCTRQFLLRELPSLSAGEQQAYLGERERKRFHMTLSMGCRQADNPAIVEASAAWLLNGKAIAVEAQSMRSRLEREIEDSDGRAVLAQMQSIRSQEAALALRLKDPEAAAKQRQVLEARRRELEKKLAPRGSAASKLANPWIDLAELRKRIDSDSIVVDVVRFPVYRLDNKTGKDRETPRYVAWLIPATGAGPIHIVGLGEAARIDAAIRSAREALEGTIDRLEKRESEKKLEADAAGKLEAVAKLVFEPLKPHLGKARQLIISPDGDLWLLPWAALPVGKDHYLVEDYTLRFVVTGRDLVEDGVNRKVEAAAALILADPDYNATPTQVAEASPSKKGTEPIAVASTRGLENDLRGIGRVKRLPGTVAEARQAFEKLKALSGTEPRLFKDAQASETIVKGTRSPNALVLATHGYFLKEEETKLKDGPSAARIENPLLRCGLLLAGANKRADAKDGQDDGVLTGLEIVGLDLRGTQMVVLSACETGVGDVQTGEGVAGLRQAFQLAGAESVLSTLWQISDSATSKLMGSFYDELAKGTDRAEALSRAQRQFIKERREKSGAAHPFYWASFTLTGK